MKLDQRERFSVDKKDDKNHVTPDKSGDFRVSHALSQILNTG